MNDVVVPEAAPSVPVRITAAEAAKALTGRRKVFADLMLSNPLMSATEAARQAGFAPGACKMEGSALTRDDKVLVYIGACIREGLGYGVEAVKFDVLKKLYAIAMHDPRDIVDIKTVNQVVKHSDGSESIERRPIVSVKDSKEWSEHITVAVSEVFHSGGKVGVKFYDRMAALNALARIVKLVDSSPRPTVQIQHRQASLGADGKPDTVSEVRVTYVEGGADVPEGLVEA